tara:strand:+ start:1872 stop:2747 length:876 start_codon:yes stop_codon:yes gene_type:complete
MIGIKDNTDKAILETILKYIILPINKNNSKTKKKQSRLEELVQKDKSKSSKSILENIIEFLKKKDDKKIKKFESIELSDNEKSIEDMTDEDEIRYSIAMERKNENKESFGYEVSITYEETEVEERLSVKVTFEDGSLDNYSNNIETIKKEKIFSEKDYSLTIKKKKEKNDENKARDNYSIKLVYENNYEKERLNVSYKSTKSTYLNRRQDALHNFEDRVPGKHVNVFPESIMGGVLGFTYLGENFMGLRADLTGRLKNMVDIHESIHTPDEYETRILTDWIMSKPKGKYVK